MVSYMFEMKGGGGVRTPGPPPPNPPLMYKYLVLSLSQYSLYALKQMNVSNRCDKVVWSSRLSALKKNNRLALYRWRACGYLINGAICDDIQNVKRTHKRALKEHKRMRSRAHLQQMSDAIDSANSSNF